MRYATCGAEDRSYAQPFERHHLQKHKWFSFAFNGQLANYQELRDKLLADGDNHLARDTDTEIIMHEISRELSGDRRPPLVEVMRNISQRFDGAYSLVLAQRPGRHAGGPRSAGHQAAVLCQGRHRCSPPPARAWPLLNLGFQPESIQSLLPGQAITIVDGEFEIERFARSRARGPLLLRVDLFRQRRQHAGRPQRVSLAQGAGRGAGPAWKTVPIDEDTIVVPVPDTSKAAADAMAYKLERPVASKG